MLGSPREGQPRGAARQRPQRSGPPPFEMLARASRRFTPRGREGLSTAKRPFSRAQSRWPAPVRSRGAGLVGGGAACAHPLLAGWPVR